MSHPFSLLATAILTIACSQPMANVPPQEKKPILNPPKVTSLWGRDYQLRPDTALQVAEIIRSVLPTADGQIWIGTGRRGLAHYKPDRLVYYTISDGLPSNQINDLLQDRDGTIWVATSNGVAHFKEGKFITYSVGQAQGPPQAYCLFQDAKGTLWCGHHLGVSRFNGTAFELYNLGIEDHVYCLGQDPNGTLWAGTACSGGITFERGAMSPVDFPKNGNCTRVSCIFSNSKGQTWFGTGTHGLLVSGASPQLNEAIRKLDLKGEVWAMSEAPNGDLWFAEIGNGLYRYRNGEFTHFGLANGLDAHAIQSMAFDQQGRLWLGSGNGLFRMDGEQFVNVTKQGPW